MINILLIVHILVALSLLVSILLSGSRSSIRDFGTIFSSKGSAFTKRHQIQTSTIVIFCLGALFFITSLSLTYINNRENEKYKNISVDNSSHIENDYLNTKKSNESRTDQE